MRILAAGESPTRGMSMSTSVIAIPVGCGIDVRIVRMGHRGHQAERPPIAAARDVEQLLRAR